MDDSGSAGPQHVASDLWAVSCHFNPGGYARRRTNHRRFRERLGLPLLTIELSHDGRFDLTDDDADRVMRLVACDVLWQKERLLNIAIRALPPACRHVAWLDGDVLFARDDWHVEAVERLRHDVLVQPFSHFTDLARDVADVPTTASAPGGRSFASLFVEGGHEQALFDAMWGSDAVRCAEGERVQRRLSSGFAWVGRRDVIQQHGLYDACIIGSGDRAIACAAAGRAATATQNFLRSAAQRRHYLAWAQPFEAEVAGRLGCVEGTVHHLWHGELADRRYRDRWRDVAALGFDPFTDIEVDAEGPWRWASDKPDLHAYVRRYFSERQEDGRGAPPAGTRPSRPASRPPGRT